MPVESSRWQSALLMWLVLVLHLHIATAQTEGTRDGQMPRESTNSTAFLLELVELGEVCYQPHLVRAHSLLRAGSVTRVLQGRCSQVQGNEDLYANCGQKKDAVSCLNNPDAPSDVNSKTMNTKCEVCCAKLKRERVVYLESVLLLLLCPCLCVFKLSVQERKCILVDAIMNAP